MGMAGRAVRIKYDADGAGGTAAALIAKAKSDSLTINNEQIDITSKDEAGIATSLNDIGIKSVEMSCSGILVAGAQHRTLIGLAMNAGAGAALHYFELEAVGVGTWRAQFFITSFQLGGEDGPDAATFEMSLASSGPVSFVAAS